MFFTGKGDDGTTKTFGCNQRISKSSAIAEALGTVDELNSLLGWVKVEAEEREVKLPKDKGSVASLVHKIQQDLFIIQAELAGADKTIEEGKVKDIEKFINSTERSLPEIKTFFISGGDKLASMFDFARTVARRAERRVIAVNDEGYQKVGGETMAYLNRLSSILYALARFSNHLRGFEEEPPSYR